MSTCVPLYTLVLCRLPDVVGAAVTLMIKLKALPDLVCAGVTLMIKLEIIKNHSCLN